MQALVYHGPGTKAWERVPDPSLAQPTDAVVRIDTTTICGTDLHILKGDVPAVSDGRILGHEGVGTVVEVGRGVRTIRPGERAIVSCIAPCGCCSYCKRQLQAHCLDREGAPGIGWIFGHLIDGTQAEYVRVPFADQTLHRVPANVSDEAAMMLSDVLPTAFEIGVRNGGIQPGCIIAVVGAGPIGLGVAMTAGLFGAARIIAIDRDDGRLELARSFGATDVVNNRSDDWRDRILALTDRGLGVDVAVEAVGIPQTFDMCVSLIRPGGAVANIGVHGAPVTLDLQDLWIKDVRITTGLVSANTTSMLLSLVAQRKLEPERLVTHRFGMDQMLAAYDTFGRAAETHALKVAISRRAA